ncbi:MAG: dephospho-CoA kinase [Methyloprofundus sp.]|nr:dephospho-CoA kinase [Methyloprofundus sp.]
MYKVGLTGGIGSGKSVVSDLFKQLAVSVIDADEIAHALVAPKQIALKHICASFGGNVLTVDGSLDRSKLREIIFNDPKKKSLLEHIMHPLIYAEIDAQVNRLQAPYVIIAIPLLIETKMQALVNHILVVDCPVEMQVDRVKSRDKLNNMQITAIINSQVSRAERLEQADSIIDNTQSLANVEQQVHSLHAQFLKQTL